MKKSMKDLYYINYGMSCIQSWWLKSESSVTSNAGESCVRNSESGYPHAYELNFWTSHSEG